VRIGELAAEVGLTTKTIRYYESIGLLDEPPRTPSGYRAYDADAVDRLQFVREAQATGLSLAEIGSILEIKGEGGQSCSHTRALLDQHLEDLDRQIVRLQVARSELARLAERAADLDPATCTDANRCQVISAGITRDSPAKS
jgi:DNA-binding transcriptional MerR regulator